MDIAKVKAGKIESLADYTVILCLTLVSVRSLELYQATAIDAGVLEESEVEKAKTIIWELRRLEKLVINQIKDIEQRMPEQIDIFSTINKLSGKRAKKVKES